MTSPSPDMIAFASSSTPSGNPGLVSILCRSMNRPELTEALLSVDKQTYPHIEIVLVDASGKGVTRWQSLGLRTPVREVSGQAPWNRPAAANAALSAAKGEYLMFLDEDDWIAPDHVRALVETLQHDARLGVVYSSTRNTAPDGTLLDATMRIAFDAARLRRDNFIPIHSALFRSTLVGAGCRFDETLDIFEDWDFWLQCASLAPFEHIDVISAFYRQGGESNTASQDPRTRYAPEHPIARARARVFDKWRGRWTGEQLNETLGSLDETALVETLHADIARLNRDTIAVHEQTRALGDELAKMHTEAQRQNNEIRGLHQQMNKLGQTLNKKAAELDGARAQAAQLSADLQMVLHSLSWRVTKPLRWARRKLDALRPARAAHALPAALAPTVVSTAGADVIHCNLDIPSAAQNEFPELITLQGWCCAPSGIAQIEAKIDGASHSVFNTGISRPDIAELFKDIPDAFNAGFYQEIALPDLAAGEHQLELVFQDKAGNVRSLSRGFVLFKNDDLYNTWYWRNMPDEAEVAQLRAHAGTFASPAQFHLLVEATDDEEALFATLASLTEQSWPFWHLHLASPKSAALEHYVSQSLPAAAATQWYSSVDSALEEIAGHSGWTLFLRAGETLAPHALSEMGQAALSEATQIVYSDHDLCSATGTHLEPCFTPQWAPEHLYASNYVGGVFALRTALLARCKNCNTDSRVWRYACLLAISHHEAGVQRIPKILWTAPAETSSNSASHKATLLDAELAALRAHLLKHAPGAQVVEQTHGLRAVLWPLERSPKVSIIIPTMGKLEVITPCIETLLATTAYKNYEVVILDNGRGKYPEGIQYLRDKQLSVIECNEPFNWARLNNTGTRHASGELYLFLNDDVEITSPDWLEHLVRQAMRPEVGAVGALLYYSNGALQHTGVLLVNYGGGGIHLLHKRMPSDAIYRMLHATVREVSANTGACLMVSRDKFDHIGGFDEELAVVGNDVDLCLRLLDAGYRNLWTPLCSLIHHESISRKTSVPKEDEKAMWQRWSKRFVAGDAWYNPNLSAEKGDFTLQVNNARSIVGTVAGKLATPVGSAAELTTVAAQPGVNLIGYTRAEMGIGEGARSDAKALDAANEPFGIICFQSGNPSRMTDLSWEHKEMSSAPYDITLLHINPDHALQAINELPPTYFDGHYRIGYWAWELPEIPVDWEKAYVHFDEIWVPSHFVQEAVAMKSPVPVVRMPHAVEVSVDPALDRASFGLPADTFLFLAMFDTYSRPERKNPFGAMRAFQNAFDPDDLSVHLVLKVNNPTPDAMSRIRDAIGAHRNILLLDKVYSRKEVNSLIATCDCYVSLHRSEGFGFGPAEAMALGKAVMATNWSGNTDYMRPSNCIGIDYTLVPIAEDHGPYKKGQIWAEPDEAHATRAMQQLVGDPALARQLGEHARATIDAEFSPLAVGRMMRKRLAAIRQILADTHRNQSE